MINKINVSDKSYLLVLAGPSGCGKSSIEKNLLDEYPDYFHKLKQVTNRPRRDKNEDSYIHLTNEQFSIIEPILIGRLDNFYKYKYGTLPDFNNEKINTIILAKDAIIELNEMISNGDINVSTIIIGIDKPLYNSPKRDGRSKENVIKEKEVFELCDTIIKLESDEYVENEEIINILKNIDIIS